MSSGEEDAAFSKKRKLQYACDYCRKKKSADVIAPVLWAYYADVWLYSQMYGDISIITVLCTVSPGPLVGDGPQKVGGRCARCILRNIQCTYHHVLQVWDV